MEKKHREWRERWLPKGARRCEKSASRFQLRVRVGPLKNDSVNFGTYPSVAELHRVSRLVNKRRATGEYIWDSLFALQASGDVPEWVLPRWVRRGADGLYSARVRKHGQVIEVTGFPTAIDAHDALRERLSLPPMTGAANRSALKREPAAVPSASDNRRHDKSK